MRGKRLGVVIALISIVVIVVALFLVRGLIAKRVYFDAGRDIVAKMPPKVRAKYEEEFDYTLEKFWDTYRSQIVSQNDMTDVMERMRLMSDMPELTDSEVFAFIGFVSRIYTDAMQRHHERTWTDQEQERAP